jgi:ectoine hydroxylase-related dioxygenase (phytanoyl-CoA dioxygenase family)
MFAVMLHNDPMQTATELTHFQPHLSPEEIAAYRERGYLIPRYRLSPEWVKKMQGALNLLIENNPGVRPEKLVSAHVARAGRDNGEGVRGVSDFLELAMHPDIVDLVAQIIGGNVILWGCHVFCKPAHEGFETPWHQDGHYWPIRPLATCTVWVALEPSNIGNGCLRVMPGSHLGKVLHPHLHEDRDDLTLQQRITAESFDESEAVDLELEPGQMSLHDVYMIHGAKANTSGLRRTGVALRYMPSSSHFDRSLKPVDGKTGVSVSFATRPLWLLKGEDVCGLNDFEIGH